MKIIYTETHKQHDPPYQLFGDGLKPYSEVPERADRILQALRAGGRVEVIPPGEVSLDPVLEVHDAGYIHFLERVYADWSEAGRGSEIGIIPDTFAMRSLKGKPETPARQAGYYCFETQTPIVQGTYGAAVGAARCALTGAELLVAGEGAAYALCRPPGHHAGRDLYGGYCYLNNAAVAAVRLNRKGRVAVLDVDYHHGNGTQDIFYASDAVLFVSIHADPNRVYPFFSGFPDEAGEGVGRGFNRNFPLTSGVDEVGYLEVLDRALAEIRAFDPAFLVVSLGVDIYKGDPLGDFDLPLEAFVRIGEQFAGAGLPTLFVQEGGYNTEALGGCVGNVLEGFERSSG